MTPNVARTLIAALGLVVGGSATVVAQASASSGAGHGGAAYRVPTSINRAELQQEHGLGGHVVQKGSVGRHHARRLARDADRLKPYPKHVAFSCPAETAGSTVRDVQFRADGHVWRYEVGTCGTAVVFASRDGHHRRALHNSKAYSADLRRDLRAIRPRSEQVPASVHRAALTYQKQSFKPATKHRVAHGRRAKALVSAFDRLKVQSPHAVVCDIAGGPVETVSFRTSHHHWVATESTCAGMQVSRDHKVLPTLVPTAHWDRLVRHDLR